MDHPGGSLRLRGGSGISQDILHHFVQNLGLHRLLNEMARAFLQGRDDVLLVANRRDHDDARIRALADNALSGLDAFHLRHGDVHQHDVGLSAAVLGDCGATVASLTGHLTAEGLDHLCQVLACKNRVVNDQVTNRPLILASNEWGKLLHKNLTSSSVQTLVQTSRNANFLFSLGHGHYWTWARGQLALRVKRIGECI